MQHGTSPQPQQPTPPQPEPLRAPLPPQAQTALARLDKAFRPAVND